MTKKLLPIFIVIASVVIGGSFFAGMKYAQSKGGGGFFRQGLESLSSEQRQQRMQQTGSVGGFRAMGGNNRGEGFIAGEIISKDDTIITVKFPDGGSKIVFFSSATEITKSAEGNSGDLVLGETIMVSGTTNSDGSVTASLIQLRPEMPILQNINQ